MDPWRFPGVSAIADHGIGRSDRPRIGKLLAQIERVGPERRKPNLHVAFSIRPGFMPDFLEKAPAGYGELLRRRSRPQSAGHS